MGWFSDIFSPEVLLPIAAGMAFGPGGMMLAGKGTALTATAAGAAAGGGLAAIKGEDPLAGAISGGLGGMSGGNIYSAFKPTSAAMDASKAAVTKAAAETGKQGIAALKPALSQGYSFGGFKEGLQNLGGGGKYSTAIGTGKLASTGLMGAGMAGLDQPPMTVEDDGSGKYDPNATLNLSGDSGLRLIASGGYIGKRNYADGGYLEGGPAEGDGMSDDIPATIDETQPAALSEGEFVIPADVVAFAGNGSSDAGARRFYEMMEQIRRDATGRPEQIREIEVEDYMPYSSESRSF